MNWRALPYLIWLFVVLAPLGFFAYGVTSILGTIYANGRDGWRDHR